MSNSLSINLVNQSWNKWLFKLCDQFGSPKHQHKYQYMICHVQYDKKSQQIPTSYKLELESMFAAVTQMINENIKLITICRKERK